MQFQVVRQLHGKVSFLDLKLALGVKKMNHGSQLRAVKMDLVLLKSFLVKMTRELCLRRRAKGIVVHI